MGILRPPLHDHPLFALQGGTITSRPLDVVRIALPRLVCFLVVFGAGMLIGKWLDLGYAKTTTLAFTVAGNNFELAIAVAIGAFGVTSGQALAGVVGPLIEVPVLVALVYVALGPHPLPHPRRDDALSAPNSAVQVGEYKGNDWEYVDGAGVTRELKRKTRARGTSPTAAPHPMAPLR